MRALADLATAQTLKRLVLGECWRAGGSLASALQVRDEWMTPAIAAQPPFRPLIEFLLRVAAGA